jgi:predicted deacetylase
MKEKKRYCTAQKTFILTFILFFLHLPSFANTNKLKVLLRFDDISVKSDAQLEKKLFDTVEYAGGQILIGVIPFPDLDNCESISENTTPGVSFEKSKIESIAGFGKRRVLEVALHGCNHRINQGETELAKLSLSAQKDLLEYGRRYLQSTLNLPIRFFIPTANKYNLNTIAALAEDNFEGISAGISNILDNSLPIKMVPGTTYPQNMRKRLSEAISKGVKNGYMVIVMHSYDFVESKSELPLFRHGHEADFKITIEHLQRDLLWINHNNQLMLSKWDEIRVEEDFSPNRMRANWEWQNSILTRRALLPANLTQIPIDGIFYTQEDAESGKIQQEKQATILYGAIFLMPLLIVITFVKQIKTITLCNLRNSIFLILGLLIVIMEYSVINGFYIKAALLVTVLIGAAIGLAGMFFARKTQILQKSSMMKHIFMSNNSQDSPQ